MSRRRRSGAIAVGVAWFDREQWDLLCQVAADRDKLDDTFEEWEANARRALDNIKSEGVDAKPFPVRVDELVRWCAERHYPLMARPAHSTFHSCLGASVLGPNPALNRTGRHAARRWFASARPAG
jgi:hypothetical protein